MFGLFPRLPRHDPKLSLALSAQRELRSAMQTRENALQIAIQYGGIDSVEKLIASAKHIEDYLNGKS